MKGVALRVFGIALLLGQLLPVSGTLLCGRTHRQHACDETAQAGPAIVPARATATVTCTLGACVAPMPAVASPFMITAFVSLESHDALPLTPVSPASIALAPIPPPPRA
jgi:hypothetical protein